MPDPSVSAALPPPASASDAAPAGVRRRRLLQSAGAASALAWVGGLGGCAAPRPPLKVGTVLHPACELLFLAREAGELPEREVRLVELLSRADNLRLMEEGALDAAVLSLDEFVICRSRRLDLRIVAVLGVSDGADVLVARAGLRELGALRGKRVAVDETSMGQALLEGACASASLRLEDVVRLPMPAEQAWAQFHAGNVDAVASAEPWVSRLAGPGAVRLFDSTLLPDRLLTALAVKSHLLQVQPGPVARLVAGHFGAVDRLQRAPREAWPLMAPRLRLQHESLLQEDTAAEHLALAFRGQRLLRAVDHAALLRPGGSFDRAQQALQHHFVERRQLERAAPLQDVLDLRFLPAA
ncbi:MAG: ABC transporter substrate-binding protein [Rubrivivax sp.]